MTSVNPCSSRNSSTSPTKLCNESSDSSSCSPSPEGKGFSVFIPPGSRSLCKSGCSEGCSAGIFEGKRSKTIRQIGRASCRERKEIKRGRVIIKKTNKENRESKRGDYA